MTKNKKYLISLNEEKTEALRKELEGRGQSLSSYFNTIVLEHFSGRLMPDEYLKRIGRKVMAIMSDEITKLQRKENKK